MPRSARLDIPDCLYHVIGRGNERRDIFVDNFDRNDFMKRLRTGLERVGAKCLAWCLMPNHFHLMILRGVRPLAELMRSLMTGYAGNFNRRHFRSGHLFQNRYKAILCEKDEYLRELAAYIHLNPLRAGLVGGYKDLGSYKYCGHGELVGAHPVDIIDMEYLLQYFGGDHKGGLINYEEFALSRIGKHKGGEFSPANIVPGGSRGDVEIFDPRVMGGGEFVESILRRAGDKPALNEDAGEILRRICSETGVSVAEIKSAARSKHIVNARARYCYLAKGAGVSGGFIAKELARNSSAISYLVAKGRKLEESY